MSRLRPMSSRPVLGEPTSQDQVRGCPASQGQVEQPLHTGPGLHVESHVEVGADPDVQVVGVVADEGIAAAEMEAGSPRVSR